MSNQPPEVAPQDQASGSWGRAFIPFMETWLRLTIMKLPDGVRLARAVVSKIRLDSR